MTSQRRAGGLPGEWNAGIRRHKVDHGSPSWSPTPGPGTDYRGHMPAKLALLQQSRPNLQANRRTAHCDVRPDPCRTGVRQIPGEDREPGGRAAHYALLLSVEVIPRAVVTMPSRRRHSPGEYTDDSTTRRKPTPVSRPQVPAAEPGIRTPALRGRHHRTDCSVGCAPCKGAGQSDGRSYRRRVFARCFNEGSLRKVVRSVLPPWIRRVGAPEPSANSPASTQ
jgi:hypothetical protein